MKKKGPRTTTVTTPGVRNGGRCHARNRKHAEFLETPLPTASPPSQSPESAIFAGSKKRQNQKTKTSAAAADSPASALFTSPSRPPKTLGSISDLTDLASSRLDDLKRLIDRSHSEILKDLDASRSRLHKRFKIQNQECQKLLDEAEKEYKTMSERINKSQEAIMTSYAEFMADVQASTSRACKTSIPKISQSFEKSIDALRSRYGISPA